MNNLEKIRGKKELSLVELSKRLGMSQQALSYCEKNHLTVANAIKIANELDVNVFELLGEDAFVMLPRTEKEREILVKMLLDLELKGE